MNRTYLIGGGVAVAVLAAVLYMRAGSAPAAAADDGGATLLFTPPSPLAAPGAGDWSAGSAPQISGGTTAFGDTASLVDAMLQQDANATKIALAQSMDYRQLGQASLLSLLAERTIATLPTGLDAREAFRISGAFSQTGDGGTSFDYEFWSQAQQQAALALEQWNTTPGGSRVWISEGGAVGVQQPGITGAMIFGASGATFSLDEARAWIASHSTGEVLARASLEGISPASLSAIIASPVNSSGGGGGSTAFVRTDTPTARAAASGLPGMGSTVDRTALANRIMGR